MLLHVSWRLKSSGEVTYVTEKKFAKTYTDYGVCCRVFPYLDFDNPKTRDIPPSQYDSIKKQKLMQNLSSFLKV